LSAFEKESKHWKKPSLDNLNLTGVLTLKNIFS